MSLSTCVVRDYIYKQDGSPDVGARVTATLTRWEVDTDEGYIGPVESEAVTDDEGYFELELFPQADGSTESMYQVRIEGSERSLVVKAVVPASGQVWLRDVAALPAYPGKTEGQAALEAVAEALGYAEAAAEFAEVAEGHADAAALSAGAAAQSASDAADSADAARESEEAAEETLPHIGLTPPDDPPSGKEWVDSATGRRYTWFVDEDEQGQWVELYAAEVINNTDFEAAASAAVSEQLPPAVDLAVSNAFADVLDGVTAAVQESGENADRAESARDEAQVAAVASALELTAYNNIAEGIADVSDGQTFWVKPNTADGLARVTNFVRVDAETADFVMDTILGAEFDRVLPANNGTAVLWAVEVPNSGGSVASFIGTDGELRVGADPVSVQSRVRGLQQDVERIPANTGTTAIWAGATVDSLASIYQESDGSLRVPLLPSSVQDGIIVAQSRADLAAAFPRVGGTAAQLALSRDIKRARSLSPVKMLAVTAPYGAAPEGLAANRQRIPSVILTQSHGLLLFWGQGTASGGGDGIMVRTVRQNVQFDLESGTLTLGEIELFEAPEKTNNVVKHTNLGVALNGRRVMLYNTNNVSEKEGEYRVYARHDSGTDGVTWTDSVEVAEPIPGGTTIVTSPAGHIVTIPAGPYAGRLVCAVNGDGPGGRWIGNLVSDDEGDTWRLSTPFYPGFTAQEPGVGLAQDGTLYYTVRNASNPGKKYLAKSSDFGETIEGIGLNDDLPAPTCSSALMGLVGRMLHSSPTNPGSRDRYRLQLSYDDTAHFAVGYTPVPDSYHVGYSCIAKIDDDTVAVAFEGGRARDVNGREAIHLLIVNIREIFDHGVHL